MNDRENSPSHRDAFTLVKLLVVIAIIAILAALLVTRKTISSQRWQPERNALSRCGAVMRLRTESAFLRGSGNGTVGTKVSPQSKAATPKTPSTHSKLAPFLHHKADSARFAGVEKILTPNTRASDCSAGRLAI
jgi:type II secretory pathway pseudopilin PulG